MNLKSKLYFSLIEIVIAVTILISLLGFAGFNIRSAWKNQVFQAEVDHMLTTLRMAQDMLLVLNIETEIDFTRDGARFRPVGNINKGYDALVKREAIPLSQFSEITFDDRKGEKIEGEFKLKFLDKGFILPQGTLKLVSKTGKEAYISLPGYPAPLSLASKAPDEREQERKEQEFYDRITSSTFSDPNVQNLL